MDVLETYATALYYQQEYGGSQISGTDLARSLYNASRHIDTLTFNRIVAKTFKGLTSFQQGIVQHVCCVLADFEAENQDILQAAVSGYSINGVSLNFGASGTLYSQGGVIIPRALYGELTQTGLCYKGF